MRVRAARPEDAPAIVELFQSTFPPERLDLLIYGCAGVVSYVTKYITAPAATAELRYTVVEEGGRVVGCAELRSGKPVILNYIAVSPDVAGKGIGARLLRSALGEFPRARTVQLDVWEDNERALQWYLHLGFESVGATDWWEMPPPQRRGSEVGVISGWAHAAASQTCYGFSQLQLEREIVYTIGRLGEDWYRVNSREVLERDWVRNTLALLDPKRRVLALLPAAEKEFGAASGRKIVRSIRMEGPVSGVLRGTAARH